MTLPTLEEAPPATSSTDQDHAFQEALLPGVSRTFALTIPELPVELRAVVTNGYLLCRIADTVEDEPAIPPEEKPRLHREFAEAVAGNGDPEGFAREIAGLLSERTIPAEHELMRHAPRVLRITHGFSPRQRAALAHCVGVMCAGMPRWAASGRGRRGLRDLAELHEYCYFVAGVVGEMLTELFCEYSPEIEARREELSRLTVSFGQGLQMTNILKDIWDDLDRGFCWLPREHFLEYGFDLEELTPGCSSSAFGEGLAGLIAVAHGHLVDALDYTLLIPRREKGIRLFCLQALGMAVLTLRKIDRHRDFRATPQVKITRKSVKATVLASNLAAGSDRMLRLLFAIFSAGLPGPASWEAGK